MRLTAPTHQLDQLRTEWGAVLGDMMENDKDNGGIFTTESLTVLKIQLRTGGEEKEEKKQGNKKNFIFLSAQFPSFLW